MKRNISSLILCALLFLSPFPSVLPLRPHSAELFAAENSFPDEYPSRSQALRAAEDFKAEAALVYDLKNKTILFEKDSDKEVSPASLTKLFVIDFVLHFMKLEDTVEVTQETLDMVPEGSSIAALRPGKYSVYHLVGGMLIPSGNDAALALAVGAARTLKGDPNCDGDFALSVFNETFSKYLKEENYSASSLSTPSGFSYEDRSSAKDLLRVCLHLLENDHSGRLQSLMKSANYEGKSADGQAISWINTNRTLQKESLFFDRRAEGIKTGSLENCYNLITLIKDPEKTCLCITLGAPDEVRRYTDNMYLMKKAGLSLDASAAGYEESAEERAYEQNRKKQEELEKEIPEILD